MNQEETPQEVLSEEERYANLKKLLGEDAEKYFSVAPSTSSTTSNLASDGMSGATKFFIIILAVFILVMGGVFFVLQSTQNTEFSVTPGSNIHNTTPPTSRTP